MGIDDFRSFDLNTVNTLKSQRSIKHVHCIFVFPHDIPSNKKFRLDSTFCKVLFTKSVVTFRKGHQNSHVKSKQKLLFIYT